MNRVHLYGNVGKDPESKKTNDKTLTKFSLATNKTYTNSEGNKVTDTQWHQIVLWGKVAETAAKYVKKGTSLIIVGEISYRNYENKEGVKIYVTDIIGHDMYFTGSKPESKEESPVAKEEWKGKKDVKSMSDIDELPHGINDEETPY